jgi:predicted enzyme related to lactoylglutathione lyase
MEKCSDGNLRSGAGNRVLADLHRRYGRAGINGGLLASGGPVKSTTNTIQVDSVDATAAAVKSAGGKQHSPKAAIPGVGYFAYCEDTEGNVFGLMQNDTNAK